MKKILFLASLGIVAAVSIFIISSYLFEGSQTDPFIDEGVYDFPDEPILEGRDVRSNEELVQREYEEFITQKAGVFSWKQFSNDRGEVPLSDGLSALNVDIPDELSSMLKQSNWGVLSCESDVNSPTFVFRTEVKLMPADYVGDLYDNQLKIMRDWESTLVNDVKPIIFPDTYYADVANNETFNSASASDRYAIRTSTVSFADGQKGILAYLILGDYVLIATDIDCLIEISGSLIEGDVS